MNAESSAPLAAGQFPPAAQALVETQAATPHAIAARAASRSDRLERAGKALIVAGWIVSVAGIVLYCLAGFAAGSDADLAAILFEDAAPSVRATLGVLGAGTLLWLAGSLMYLGGALDPEEPPAA